MNKASLINTINNFITSIVNINKHRNSMLELINVLFQTRYTISVPDANNVLSYQINFKKQGNVVHVDGYLKNGTSQIIPATIGLIEFNNSLYNVKDDTAVGLPLINNTTFAIGQIILSTDLLTLASNLGSGSRVSFNGHYQTND